MLIFRKNIISWACVDGSGLKNSFYLLAQRPALAKSLFSFCEVLVGSLVTENIKVSSAKSLTWGSRLLDKLLIYIKEK